jgi:hypothetical protein
VIYEFYELLYYYAKVVGNETDIHLSKISSVLDAIIKSFLWSPAIS